MSATAKAAAAKQAAGAKAVTNTAHKKAGAGAGAAAAAGAAGAGAPESAAAADGQQESEEEQEGSDNVEENKEDEEDGSQAAAIAATAQYAAAAVANAAAAAASRVQAPRLPAVVPFTGAPAAFDEWISSLERVFYACNTPQEGRVRVAAPQMAGPAWEWFIALEESERPTSWADLLSGLRGRFVAIDSSDTARDKLHAYTQGKRTTVDYVDGFRRLVARIPDMGAVDQLSQFIRGLRASTASILKIAGVSTLKAAIDMAVRAGAISEQSASSGSSSSSNGSESVAAMETDADAPMTRGDMQEMLNAMMAAQQNKSQYRDHGRRGQRAEGSSSSRTSTSNSNSNSSSVPAGANKARPTIRGLTDTQVKEYMDSDKCFNCGVVGHQSRRCPKPRKAN